MSRLKPLLILAVPLLCVAATAATSAARDSDRPNVTAAMGISPGRWVSTIATEALDLEPVPGGRPLEEQVLTAARGQIGRVVRDEDCVADVAVPGNQLLLPGIHVGPGCTVELLEVANGRLRYKADCRGENGFRTEMSGEAIYTATMIEGRHSLSAVSPGAGVVIRSTMGVRSRHDGVCRAPPPAPPPR